MIIIKESYNSIQASIFIGQLYATDSAKRPTCIKMKRYFPEVSQTIEVKKTN